MTSVVLQDGAFVGGNKPVSSEVSSVIIRLSAEQVDADLASVTPATHYVNDLNYDSLDVVDLSMKLEDQLHVTIPDERMQQFRTVGDVIDYVSQNLPGNREAPGP
jgi:acyl carrier protein